VGLIEVAIGQQRIGVFILKVDDELDVVLANLGAKRVR